MSIDPQATHIIQKSLENFEEESRKIIFEEICE